MKKLFLIRFSVAAFFCLLCVLPALAANIKIKGAVKDKLSKEPLIGATIRLLGTQAGAVTDMEGNFELNSMGVLEGMYDIEIKYVGYKTEVRRKVRVENGKLVILNLELETDAQELADVVVVAKKNREMRICCCSNSKKQSLPYNLLVSGSFPVRVFRMQKVL